MACELPVNFLSCLHEVGHHEIEHFARELGWSLLTLIYFH